MRPGSRGHSNVSISSKGKSKKSAKSRLNPNAGTTDELASISNIELNQVHSSLTAFNYYWSRKENPKTPEELENERKQRRIYASQFAGLCLDLDTTESLMACLRESRQDDYCDAVSNAFHLEREPPSPSWILARPSLPPPDGPIQYDRHREDDIFRDVVLTHYMMEAIRYPFMQFACIPSGAIGTLIDRSAPTKGFSAYQIALWATMLYSTHVRFVETIRVNPLNSGPEVALDLFTTFLYMFMAPTTSTQPSRNDRDMYGSPRRRRSSVAIPKSPASFSIQNSTSEFEFDGDSGGPRPERGPLSNQEAVWLIDYFTDNYLKHIKLISLVFYRPQELMRTAARRQTERELDFQPLANGIAAEKWEEFLAEEDEKKRLALQAELEAVEAIKREELEKEQRCREQELARQAELQAIEDSYIVVPPLKPYGGEMPHPPRSDELFPADMLVEVVPPPDAPATEIASGEPAPEPAPMSSEPQHLRPVNLNPTNIAKIIGQTAVPHIALVMAYLEGKLEHEITEMNMRLGKVQVGLEKREKDDKNRKPAMPNPREREPSPDKGLSKDGKKLASTRDLPKTMKGKK
ncbi:uncharacterized protein BJ171DRAFT_599781 [Polychytrium aggregatum]|uniref:uncharacterized protein n=1 Tax=Polychytrium aggregatum TaxID=110093 RepID=UPI0022FF3CBE|nr:uncharacterized protein BJ171DRAFT_599781 [Polychytrium aggregatum]KAI9203884.1 hypothetical protein BJ171DRAFT_599781 [Polychytrium aggregatum]